jgi:lipopolysaccharide export system protein LptA
LCLQADDVGGIDLAAGQAFLQGNVSGVLNAQQLVFTSDTLRAYQGEGGTWERLELDRDVTLSQPTRQARADHAVLEGKELRLFGHVQLTEQSLEIEADTVRLHQATEEADIAGNAENPVQIRFQVGETLDDQVIAQAERALVRGQTRTVVLEGNARIDRPARAWLLEAQRITVDLDESREVQQFRAEGAVRLNQPGRRATADRAVTRNNNQTILLLGNAHVVQEGRLDLTSERIEIYTNAERGVVRSDPGDRTLNLSLNLDKDDPVTFTPETLATLSRQGLPLPVLDKLRSLSGRRFGSSETLRREIRGRLTAREAEQFLTTIMKAVP